MRSLSLFALLLAAACNKDDAESEQEDNEVCESECVAAYAEDAPVCADRVATCLEGCTGPDDTSCVWDCDDGQLSCTISFSTCSSRCPCATDMTRCALECPYDDLDCLTVCSDGYQTCAGSSTPYLCGVDCDTARYLCESACDSSTDGPSYAACRRSCGDSTSTCLERCL